jgi:hypothetical protein
MPRNKSTLTVIVNGTPTEVEANDHALLKTIIPKALHQTGNSGQPPDQWELKDAQGNLLDLEKKIGDYHFPDDVKLFLSLKAGVGGC